MSSAASDIQSRVGKAEAKRPSPLRLEITDLLLNHPAVTPYDGDPVSPATDKVTRYRLANGRSLAHEIQSTRQNLWFAPHPMLPLDLEAACRHSAASEGGKGRTSNINALPDLKDQPALCFTPSTLDDAKRLLNALLS